MTVSRSRSRPPCTVAQFGAGRIQLGLAPGDLLLHLRQVGRHLFGQAALLLFAGAELIRLEAALFEAPSAEVVVVLAPDEGSLSFAHPFLRLADDDLRPLQAGRRFAGGDLSLLARLQHSDPFGRHRLQFVAGAQKGLHAYLPAAGNMDPALKNLPSAVHQPVGSPARVYVGNAQPNIVHYDGRGRHEATQRADDPGRAADELPQIPGSGRGRPLRLTERSLPVHHDRLKDVVALEDKPEVVRRPEHDGLGQRPQRGRHRPLVAGFDLDRLRQQVAAFATRHQVPGAGRRAFAACHQILENSLPGFDTAQRLQDRSLPPSRLGASRPRGLPGCRGGPHFRLGRPHRLFPCPQLLLVPGRFRLQRSHPALDLLDKRVEFPVDPLSRLDLPTQELAVLQGSGPRGLHLEGRVLQLVLGGGGGAELSHSALESGAEGLPPPTHSFEPALVGGAGGHLGEASPKRLHIGSRCLPAPARAVQVRLDARHALAERGGFAL